MLIGLFGKAHSGKDTAAMYMDTTHGFHRLAFADKLKKVAADIFMLRDEQLHGELKETVDERWNLTPRRILQFLGTEIGQQLYKNIWVEWTKMYTAKIRHDFGSCEPIVITDVRFIHEAEHVMDSGGYLWKILRNGVSEEIGGKRGHSSENSLDGLQDEAFHAIISNEDGNLVKMYRQIDHALESIKEVPMERENELGR